MSTAFYSKPSGYRSIDLSSAISHALHSLPDGSVPVWVPVSHHRLVLNLICFQQYIASEFTEDRCRELLTIFDFRLALINPLHLECIGSEAGSASMKHTVLAQARSTLSWSLDDSDDFGSCNESLLMKHAMQRDSARADQGYGPDTWQPDALDPQELFAKGWPLQQGTAGAASQPGPSWRTAGSGPSSPVQVWMGHVPCIPHRPCRFSADRL